jgi:hypothetical protein
MHMSWRDKMLMKIIGNRVVLKMISMPIVMKMIAAEIKAFIWVASLFSRKKKETQTEQAQPLATRGLPPTQ